MPAEPLANSSILMPVKAWTRRANGEIGSCPFSINAIREENLRKERVPLQLALDEMDSLFQAIGAILKNVKELSPTRVNEIFEKFRAVPARLKW